MKISESASSTLDPEWGQWLKANLELAAQLCGKPGRTPVALPSMDDLERVLIEKCPDAERLPEDAGEIFHAVGLAFGQRLVLECGLRWSVTGPPQRRHLALVADGRILPLDPVACVADRTCAGERNFLRGLVEALRE